MNRLTFQEPNGSFGVVGMNAGNQDQKLYACVVKLKDYENTGLSPDEAERLQKAFDELNDFEHSQCAKLLAENGRLKSEIERLKQKRKYCGFVPDPNGKQTACIDGRMINGEWIQDEDLSGLGVLKETIFEVVSNCMFDE